MQCVDQLHINLQFQVQGLLQNMQDKFQTMSDQILNRIDEMGNRVDDLEKNISDLMTQAGAAPYDAQGNPAITGVGVPSDPLPR